MEADNELHPTLPFPSVAVELVRSFLEVAACMDKQTALALARASKAINTWITPIIYHTVILQHYSTIESFDSTLKENPRLGARVCYLIICDDSWDSGTMVGEILLACANLKTLMTDAPYDTIMPRETPGTTQLTSRPLQVLAPSCIMLVASRHVQIRSQHSLLRNVTHLYVDYPDTVAFNVLTLLPHLTYVGFGCWGDVDEGYDECLPFVRRMLERDSIQKVLIYLFSADDQEPIEGLWSKLARIEDERLIVALGLSKNEQITLVGSGDTLWDDATWKYRDWRQSVKGHDP